MKWLILGLLTLAPCVVFAEENPGGARQHASLAAYPNAVIKAEDKTSGMLVEVKEDGKDLIARKNGAVIWTVSLATGKEVGTPVIRHVSIANDKVTAVIGKHRQVTLDLASGKVLNDMSD